MWTPTTMRRMVRMPKKMTAWTRMEMPLVFMLTNSTTLPFPGSWNSSPGDNSTNSSTATTTGPQSAISCLICKHPLTAFIKRRGDRRGFDTNGWLLFDASQLLHRPSIWQAREDALSYLGPRDWYFQSAIGPMGMDGQGHSRRSSSFSGSPARKKQPEIGGSDIGRKTPLSRSLCASAFDCDIATRVVACELVLQDTPVSKVMTRNPIFVLSDTLAEEALQKMVLVIALLDITKCLYDAIARLERAAEKGKAIQAAVEGVEKNWGTSISGLC
ncbi:hypothetical protein BHM03_00042736 [Ensete ventricosum]|nr:hypothetical protein BHM03_00042736 [Ensete ventricosum]